MDLHVNRKNKDTLFRDLFGASERKANALELYNALRGTSYSDVGALELTTLDDVLYLGVKNDVSFLVGDEMVLFEQQSSHNPNMPLRGLIYFARLYSRYADANGLNLYGRRRIQLPTPRYVVFYAGEGDRPDEERLRLSDSFSLPGADLEVTATVINVNKGRSAAIMNACETLRGYALFVSKVREGARAGSLEEAVSGAVDECIAEGVLAEYFRSKKAEVIDMFMTEYDSERQRALDRDEGRAEGRAEGRLDVVLELVREGTLSAEVAAAKLGMTPDQFAARAASDGFALD